MVHITTACSNKTTLSNLLNLYPNDVKSLAVIDKTDESEYSVDSDKIYHYLDRVLNFNIRIKNVFPENLRFCLEDEFFVLHIRICYERDFKINDFIKFIRDYFILDKTVSLIFPHPTINISFFWTS